MNARTSRTIHPSTLTDPDGYKRSNRASVPRAVHQGKLTWRNDQSSSATSPTQ
jgi:hypothetical protein